MGTPRIHCEVIKAWADGHTIQVRRFDYEVWLDCSAPTFADDMQYRIKPRMIKIGDIEVPEPLREMPPEGTDVYWPSFGPATGGLYCESCEVGYYPRMLHHLLEIGMLHASAEACHQHSLALIELSKGA